ncbi:TonB-dependent receptor domain-containing protein [Pontiella sp.]|uniref:TonB-dependent receptor n=1 Tax=Pontiella sp. TaxID=2837462 RepID=UPI00356AA145
MRNRFNVSLVVGGCLWGLAAGAQLGGIRGMALDADFEVPLPGVKVRISETGQETQTGDAGSFFFEQVEPGSYTVLFNKPGYTRFTKPEVVVTAGRLAEVDASLAGEYEEMDELVVRDIQLGGASEIGLLNLRLESSAMMDSVGADLMSQAAASDAAQALSLVPGTTVQDGKYAVVRGLPDRYVVSLLNGVRLPTADPDKRAVQLDQFPGALIESIQVSKTFTPDQQGDASGGAVNVVLKSMPEEPVLSFKAGVQYKTSMPADGEFLSYEGGGLDFWGTHDAGEREPQDVGSAWSGAMGTTRGAVPEMYDGSLTAGDRIEVADGVRASALGNFYYKTDASYIDRATDDKWWFRNGEMVPVHSGEDPYGTGELNASGTDFTTALMDVEQSSEEVQWGGLGAVGLETEDHSLMLSYLSTHVAESTTTLAEDTRGKAFYVTAQVDGYDPLAATSSDAYNSAAPYRRSQTLEYVERDTSSLQLGGEHVLPIPEFGKQEFFMVLAPELDWKVSRSDSELDTPDKRMFSSKWNPGYEQVTSHRGTVTTNTVPPAYYQDKPPVSYLGNAQRIWENVYEQSRQYAFNGQLPFKQWSGDEGFLKLGVFADKVERSYTKDSYQNLSDANDSSINADSSSTLSWDDFWTDDYPGENDAMYAAEVDADYDGTQEISAWYYMVDVPLASFLTFVGGARFEKTDLSVTIVDPEDEVYWVKPGEYGLSQLLEGEADVDYHQDDVLPSLALELRPLDSITLRAAYGETVARQTFKELTPIQQQEYLGADIFIGNPTLEMSALENYDLRFDYVPYPGGLVSASWFMKKIDNPIEYTQRYVDNVGSYITAVNYPSGEMRGYEIEFRQQLGRLWSPLEGLTFGANATFIDSEVSLSNEDIADLGAYAASTRDMMNAPEHLYNLNLTYEVPALGTKLGLFYVVKGDTLVAGESNDLGYYPSVYETEYETLNFTVSQNLGKRLRLSFKAKNLTDPEIREVYRSEFIGDDTVKSSYTKGISYSIGLDATW